MTTVPLSAPGPREPSAPRGPGTITARSWTIEFPPGMGLLSLNDRMHWAVRGRVVREIRKAAWVLAKAAGIPPLERASIAVTYRPPLVTRRRDLDNVPPASGKPAIDGIVDARVLADDAPPYVTGITYGIGEPCPKGRLVLTITEAGPP
jgi:crossover junction endodeoxyribonuclease RusA